MKNTFYFLLCCLCFTQIIHAQTTSCDAVTVSSSAGIINITGLNSVYTSNIQVFNNNWTTTGFSQNTTAASFNIPDVLNGQLYHVKTTQYETRISPWKNVCEKIFDVTVIGGVDTVSSCRLSDSLNLVDFYNKTNGANWKNKWNLSKPMASWYGIGTDGNGCVIEFSPLNNNLAGNIPNSLGNLSRLVTINFNGNALTGTIPDNLSNLVNLTFLNLGSNQLSGSIPTSITKLVNLKYFYLYANQLTGTIPDNIGDMSNLLNVYFSGNQLSGNIPQSIGKLKNLIGINIGVNHLSGSIPSSIINLTNLINIDLQENQLTGAIPSVLGNLTQLKSVTLQNNLLSDSIPSSLGNLTNILELDLSSNQLSGCLPVALKSLCGKNVNLSSNASLTGGGAFTNFCNSNFGGCINYGVTSCRYQDSLGLVKLYKSANGQNWKNKWDLNTPISTWFGIRMTEQGCVYDINLFDNNLVGTLPDTFNFPNLYYLTLEKNKLSGTLPNFVLPQVLSFYIDRNLFTGSIPTLNMPNMVQMDISQNNLTGVIPEFNFPNLGSLNLSNNKLSGNLPALNFPDLQNLYLTNNQLTGNIPNLNFPKATNIWLDHNQFSGNIPQLNTPLLVTFAANNNKLSGELPTFSLPKLTYLYLGHNLFSGTIPNFNLPELAQLSLSDNTFTGSIPNFNLPLLYTLELDSNRLSGNIPNFDSLSLFRLLLNNNALTGKIPSFKFPNLFYLYLNDNQLSGCIPSSLQSVCGGGGLRLSNNPDLLTHDVNAFCNNNTGVCADGLSCSLVSATNANDTIFLSGLTNATIIQVFDANYNPVYAQTINIQPSAPANTLTIPNFKKTQLYRVKITQYDAQNGPWKFICERIIEVKVAGSLCNNDTIPPVIHNCPQDISLIANNNFLGAANWTAPTATDNCSSANLTLSADRFYFYNTAYQHWTFQLGKTKLTYTATDSIGNKSDCIFFVNVTTADAKDSCVNDTTPPVLVCPSDVKVDFDAVNSCSGYGFPIPTPQVSDNCGIVTLGLKSSSGNTVNPGQFEDQDVLAVLRSGNTFIYTAGDKAGNTSSCSFTVFDQCKVDRKIIYSSAPKDTIIYAQSDSCTFFTWSPPLVIYPCLHCSAKNLGASFTVMNIVSKLNDYEGHAILSGYNLVGYTEKACFSIGVTTIKYDDYLDSTIHYQFNVTVVKQQTTTPDLSVSIAADNPAYKKFTNNKFIVTVKNNSSTAFTNVQIKMPFPQGVVSGGNVTASAGNWYEWCAGGNHCYIWTIPNIPANTSYTLTVPVFLLDVPSITETATLVQSTPTDANVSNNSSSVTLAQSVAISSQLSALGGYQPPAFGYQPFSIQKISPNPTSDELNLDVETRFIASPLAAQSQNVDFLFYNTLGMLLRTEKRNLEQGINQINFDVSDFASGIYFIDIRNEKFEIRNPVRFVKN